ncbi:hypothetical protein PPERSA_01406 [Pseudocohnilembus persalinus]|uniref:adenine phosphoribosyltransferase n=1 Tax=Pseudocohnilembus persalinus TaxID=266149 RepID=A0A0V0QH18_PSEPJ|nr:hypothetical protein PPERSA_01406 [Pseudocohnilembus persalinus]|eukprot:KRX01503.1 hypothetical protein PPERSA_01406 [Pseudocohnilembus persalinus]
MEEEQQLHEQGKFIIDHLTTIPDWPKKGVNFKDIGPTLKNPETFAKIIDLYAAALKNIDFQYLVSLESRGFIYGTALAMKMNKGQVLIRKPGKLPGEVVKQEFQKEYGTDHFEIQKNALQKGDKVVIIDDILATGGTAKAAIDLVEKLGAETVGMVFLYEIGFLEGRKKIPENIKILSLSRE